MLATHGRGDRETLPAELTVEETRECGRATVHRVALQFRGRPTYDFVDRLEDAQVVRVYDGPGRVPRLPDALRGADGVARQRCGIWAAGRWRCKTGSSWEWVGPVVKDVDDSRRRGIWTHPLDGGHKLEVRYPAAPLGRELQVEGGLTLHAINSGDGAPVHFEVRIAGERVVEAEVGVREKRWFEWSVDTSRWAGQLLPVTFTVWTDDYRVRQWVFAGRTWAD